MKVTSQACEIAADRWHDVETEEPPKHQDVWLWLPKSRLVHVARCCLVDNEWTWVDTSGATLIAPQAWRPLPVPDAPERKVVWT